MRQLSGLRRLVVVGTYNSRYPHLPLVSEVLEIPIEFGIKIGVKIMKIRFLFLLGLVAGWPYISYAEICSDLSQCLYCVIMNKKSRGRGIFLYTVAVDCFADFVQ